MEKAEIKVLNNVKEDAKRNYQLFKWVLIEETNGLTETTLVFERDDTAPYYQDLVKLENKFNKVYTIPGWLPFVFVGLILAYVTTMAILYLTHVINVEKSIFVVILAIPTGILLLLNVFITFLRNKQMFDYVNKKEEKYQKYQQMVDQIVK